MKKVILALVAALSLAAFPSCRKQDSAADFYLAVDYAAMSLTADKGHSYIQIYANGPWTAGFEEGAQTWCRLDKTSGEGRDAIYLAYDANEDSAKRSVTFFVKREEATKKFTITQAGK